MEFGFFRKKIAELFCGLPIKKWHLFFTEKKDSIRLDHFLIVLSLICALGAWWFFYLEIQSQKERYQKLLSSRSETTKLLFKPLKTVEFITEKGVKMLEF